MAFLPMTALTSGPWSDLKNENVGQNMALMVINICLKF